MASMLPHRAASPAVTTVLVNDATKGTTATVAESAKATVVDESSGPFEESWRLSNQ